MLFNMLVLAGIAAADRDVFVDAPWVGQVRGVESSEGYDVFRGIRYGIADRFEPSRPWSNSGGAYDATSFGDACLQNTGGAPLFPGLTFSEDCLFVNVWRPARDDSEEQPVAPRPVMVYIHGGAFQTGSGALAAYHGANLAVAQDVIVVTINYRLAALGFMPVDQTGRGGLNGVGDQITALKWVRANIAAFGGDVNRVTVFGESAGSLSICVLMVSDAAKGLFDSAILQSGPCNGMWSPGEPKEMFGNTKILLEKLGVESVADLSKFSGEEILSARVPRSFMYSLDDVIMPEHPWKRHQEGRIHVDKFIIGLTSFDGINEITPFMPAEGATLEDLTKAHAAFYGPEIAKEIVKRYPPSDYHGSARAAFIRADSDHTVLCPTMRILRNAAEHNVTGYGYLHAHLHESCLPDPTSEGCCDPMPMYVDPPAALDDFAGHIAEIPFVFNMTKGSNPFVAGIHWDCTYTRWEQRLIQTMQDLWSSMAKDGRPTSDLATWAPFADGDESVVVFGGSSVEEHPASRYNHHCDFWESTGGWKMTIQDLISLRD